MTGKKEGPLDRIKVSCSPLSNNIQLYRMGRRSDDTALESKDVTNQVMTSVIDHLTKVKDNTLVFNATVADGLHGKRVKFTLTLTQEDITDELSDKKSGVSEA